MHQRSIRLSDLLIWWLPAIMWMGVIFFFSSLSTLPSAQVYWWDFIFKKSAHMAEYAVLYWLLYRAIAGRENASAPSFFWAMLVGFIYSVSDEWHQSWTPNRHPQITDLGFDSLGMWVAFLRIKGLI